MNLNNRVNKSAAALVSAVIFILYTIAFTALEKTPTLIVAYVFGAAGALTFFVGNLYFISAKSGYPWVAALPMTLWRYVITATLLSLVFVIAERTVPGYGLPYFVPLAGHILVLAFYFITLTLLHTGNKYIQEVDVSVAQKTDFIRGLTTEVMEIKRKAPAETARDVAALADAVRYSDPMSHFDVEALESDIQTGIERLRDAVARGDVADIQKISADTTALVKDRAERVRALKRGN
jgi:hypothetical protein